MCLILRSTDAIQNQTACVFVPGGLREKWGGSNSRADVNAAEQGWLVRTGKAHTESRKITPAAACVIDGLYDCREEEAFSWSTLA